jgi:uridine kinase
VLLIQSADDIKAYVNILILGASGSGQTTLGNALASKLAFTFLDADDFYWLPTTPAYQEKRDISLRLSLIIQAMESKSVVIAGSVLGWGHALEECFDLIVFLSLDTEIRLSRLKVREQQELGFVDDDFIAWAKEYENPNFSSRNRVKHLDWLASKQAKVISIEGDLTVEQRLTLTLSALEKGNSC